MIIKINAGSDELTIVDKIEACRIYYQIFCTLSESLNAVVDLSYTTLIEPDYFEFILDKLKMDFDEKMIQADVAFINCCKKVEDLAKNYFTNVFSEKNSSYFYQKNEDISGMKYH